MMTPCSSAAVAPPSNNAAALLDVAGLEAELATCRRRFDAWAAFESEAAEDARDAHLAAMRGSQGALRSLKQQRAKQVQLAEEVQTRLEREHNALSAFCSSGQSVRGELEAGQARADSLQRDVAAQQEELRSKIAELAAHEGAKHKRLSAFKQALALYEQRLGLHFEQGTDVLQLHFTHINDQDYSERFTVSVRVQGDNTYEVLSCRPKLTALPQLVGALNETNNFSQFVKSVRAAFKELSAMQHVMLLQ